MNIWSSPWFDPWQNLTRTKPWQSTLEDWWGQFSKQPASPSMNAFENIVAQSRSFFKIAEELGKNAVPADAAADWQAAMEQIFDGLRQTFDNPDAAQAQNLWQMPLANWQRTVSSLSSMPGDLFAGLPTPGGFDPNAKLDQFLGTPGVGYARELQGQHQELARLVLSYQKANQKYVAIFAEIGKQSLDCMRARLLARMGEDKEAITSVRELYDLWVDCSEEVYGRHVLTDEYAQLHGEMVNALMALKRQGALMMDDAAGAMNMPTRKEMDTVHRRFQDARRKEKGLQRDIAELKAGEKELVQRLERLAAAMERLEKSEAALAAPRKSAAKQKKASADKPAVKAPKTRGKRAVKRS